MIGNYITIDGISSRSFGLFCKQLPMFPVAVKNVNPITVDGRLENLYQSLNHYNDITIDIEAVLIGLNMDEINRWLHNGKRLVLSNQPDRYAIIRQIIGITQQRTGNGALELRISLKCSPFKFNLDNDPIEFYSSPAYFTTNGSIYSEPLIIAKGCSAGFAMALNDVALTATGITGNLYIDVPNRVIYQILNNQKTVVQDHTSGKFWNMLLVPKESELGPYNELTFANCNSIEITKNERWL